MSDTIDVGIDLGTTNSAIAVARNGEAPVVKNNDGWDVTPSAVWIPKRGMVHVGRQARERVTSDPGNAAAEFKLEMGLAGVHRTFEAAGVALTPQQLSAEVLKSLRADVEHIHGTAPDAAVITVPAAFALNQNKATKEAAELAGFDVACPLVQEPTAAAFAYGVHNTDVRAYWMVFDFGGGTFDAAVVRKHDGDLRVLNHAGDPYLGGKLIDWALIDRVLAPAAARELGLRDFGRENPKWRINFAKLKLAAEEAKMQLSRRERVDGLIDLTDEEGNPQPFEFSLRRDELDGIAEPFYARAIHLCRNALDSTSLGPDDIDRLLLVGGQTLSPGLRERLADPQQGLGIQLDVSVDPTVVVAQGAAIYASTVRRPRRTMTKLPPGEFAIELAYEPRVTTTRPTIGGRVHSSAELPADDWTTYSVVLSNPAARPPFRSARIPLSANGTFLTEVDLDPNQASTFTIELTDDRGTRCQLTPDSVTITHGTGVPSVQVAHSLGIQLADQVFAPMLHKGAALPATARSPFHTSGPLHRSNPNTMVRIPVVQGERGRADRNRRVGMLEIRPEDVRIDLPAGTEVEITFMVDESNLVTVVADVPLTGEQFEAQVNLDDVRPTDPDTLRRLLHEAEDRYAVLQGQAGGSPEARRKLDQLEAEGTLIVVREQVQAASVDAGAAATAEDRMRDLQAELDDVADAVQLPALVQQVRELLAEAAELVDQLGQPADRDELARLRSRAEEAIQAQDLARVRALLDKLNLFLGELERRHPDFQIRLFYGLEQWLPKSGPASQLFREGQRAIDVGDRRALESVNQRLIRLLPPEDREQAVNGLVTR